jgi:site-specific recombinase XerD
VEVYARGLEEDRHLAPATVARRLSTVIGFYRFMVIDGRLDKSPGPARATPTQAQARVHP